MKIAVVERYKKLCQKNEDENYILDKYIFRKISIYFTIVFIKLGITANLTTFLSLLASLASLYFLMFNSTAAMIIAAVLIFSYYMLDHVDGELARYYITSGRQKASRSGQYFDLLVHRYSGNLMAFFMGVSVYRLFGYECAILLGFIASVTLSSFPNLVAAHVLSGKIARDPDSIKQPGIEAILQRLERKQNQIRAVRGSMLDRSRKTLGELLFFPGYIILFIAVLIVDSFVPAGFELLSCSFNFRLLFLTGITFIFTLKSVIQGYRWIVRFKDIS